jgi:hypothetical protein
VVKLVDVCRHRAECPAPTFATRLLKTRLSSRSFNTIITGIFESSATTKDASQNGNDFVSMMFLIVAPWWA